MTRRRNLLCTKVLTNCSLPVISYRFNAVVSNSVFATHVTNLGFASISKPLWVASLLLEE